PDEAWRATRRSRLGGPVPGIRRSLLHNRRRTRSRRRLHHGVATQNHYSGCFGVEPHLEFLPIEKRGQGIVAYVGVYTAVPMDASIGCPTSKKTRSGPVVRTDSSLLEQSKGIRIAGPLCGSWR